jgi:hypothetical protein
MASLKPKHVAAMFVNYTFLHNKVVMNYKSLHILLTEAGSDKERRTVIQHLQI